MKSSIIPVADIEVLEYRQDQESTHPKGVFSTPTNTWTSSPVQNAGVGKRFNDGRIVVFGNGYQFTEDTYVMIQVHSSHSASFAADINIRIGHTEVTGTSTSYVAAPHAFGSSQFVNRECLAIPFFIQKGEFIHFEIWQSSGVTRTDMSVKVRFTIL